MRVFALDVIRRHMELLLLVAQANQKQSQKRNIMVLKLITYIKCLEWRKEEIKMYSYQP